MRKVRPHIGGLVPVAITRCMTKNAPKRVPCVPSVETPLFTNFQKWAGKKKMLYFSRDDISRSKPLMLPNFNLNGNMFAQMLQKPIRLDTLSRVKVPRAFLVQLKVHKLAVNNENKKLIELAPAIISGSHSSSSYVPLSRQALATMSLSQLLPSSVKYSKMRHFDVSEVAMDRDKLTTGYEEKLVNLVTDGLKELVGIFGDEADVGLENWDILVTYDERNSYDMELRQFEDLAGKPVIIIFNLRFLRSEELDRLINVELKTHEYGIILKIPKNENLIKFMYNLIAFKTC
ncbi:Rrg8p Ecym_4416 [Eremothecium cymbalariae DBVPG|uniref:Required for respiratory growth protein 8, mitochondrial n=1 Tax=Eremothecium cymbalariae (strain CBS 270.75 / DBVPG 7215 / KCTC 17166 / NRRL Y-17582) TaxID=931890 RepID=G8JTW4_ERECY|nr:hypothetical protein Ecym_4416 [Eremothecium cymbalariae DBVPG\